MEKIPKFDGRGVLTVWQVQDFISVVWDAANFITVMQTSKEIRSQTQGNHSLLEILLADFNYAAPHSEGSASLISFPHIPA